MTESEEKWTFAHCWR